MAIHRNTVINERDSLNKSYFVTPSGITVVGSTKTYKTYEEMLADRNPPTYGSVLDATGDPTVEAGSALYKYSNGRWKKLFEEEVMDQDHPKWEVIVGKPTSPVEEIDEAVTVRHSHDNKDALDRFSLVNNRIAFDGTNLPVMDEVISITNRVSNNESQIHVVNETLVQHGSILGQHESAIRQNENNIAGLQSTASTLSTNIESIEETLDTKANQSDITSINSNIDQVTMTINGINGDIVEIRDSVAEISRTAGQAIVSVRNQLNTINDTLEEKASVEMVETTSAGLNERITALEESSSKAFLYKGIATYDQLFTPGTEGYIEDMKVGDIWQVPSEDVNGATAEYIWNGTMWDELGTTVDLSPYATKAEVSEEISSSISASAMTFEYPAEGTTTIEAVANSWVFAPAGGANVVLPSTAPNNSVIKITVKSDSLGDIVNGEATGTYVTGPLMDQPDGQLVLDAAGVITFQYIESEEKWKAIEYSVAL